MLWGGERWGNNTDKLSRECFQGVQRHVDYYTYQFSRAYTTLLLLKLKFNITLILKYQQMNNKLQNCQYCKDCRKNQNFPTDWFFPTKFRVGGGAACLPGCYASALACPNRKLMIRWQNVLRGKLCRLVADCKLILTWMTFVDKTEELPIMS